MLPFHNAVQLLGAGWGDSMACRACSAACPSCKSLPGQHFPPLPPAGLQADTLTARELQERKRAVRTSLGLPPRSTLLYPAQPSLLADALAAVGLGEAQGPLSAIAGDGLDTSVGRQVVAGVRAGGWVRLDPSVGRQVAAGVRAGGLGEHGGVLEGG